MIPETVFSESSIFYVVFSLVVVLVSALLFRKSQKSPKLDGVRAVASDFQWDSCEAIQSYPFKNAAYKLTMGIKKLEPQDWLLVEPSYKKALDIKKQIITNSCPGYDKETRPSTFFCTEESGPAVTELYEYVTQYLCIKYPMCFKRSGTMIHNLITGESYPLAPAGSPREYLESLAGLIEEDFIILLKDPLREQEVDGTEYFFKAGIFAFAAGFDPADRFNMPLSFIHHPIPGYKEKLKLSMNRFFDRIAPNEFVTRSNFSVQTHGKYYVDDSNKGHNLPEGHIQEPLPYSSLDFEKGVHYRSERQVLTKLPKSGAVVFTIRTYLQPMAELKAAGDEVCARLVGAIKGFPPEISDYKRAGEWGPPLIKYLELRDE